MMELRNGDVLVSRATARIEHDVSIVPTLKPLMCPNYDAAVRRARELAKERQVDAWLTEDFIHVVKIASYRTDAH